MGGGSRVDREFAGFLLHWVVSLACLLAAPLATHFLSPVVGVPFLAIVLAFYVWWDGRTMGPSGCIATFPFFLATIGAHLWAITAMTKALLAANAR